MEGVSGKNKRKRDAVPKDKSDKKEDNNPKQLWLMTFGSSSPDVTIEMLEACGVKDEVKAIHNATWRESKYTLLSLSRKGRMRGSQVNTLVKKLSKEHSMVSTEIMGYESIIGNIRKSDDSIPFHPGFKLMVDFLQTGKGDNVRSWTKETAPSSSKRKAQSYLQRHVGTSDIDAMSKAQLQTLCHTLKKIVDETEPIRATFGTLQNQLVNAEGQLMTQGQLLQRTRAALRRAMAKLWDETGSPGDRLSELVMKCGCNEFLSMDIIKDLELTPEEMEGF